MWAYCFHLIAPDFLSSNNLIGSLEMKRMGSTCWNSGLSVEKLLIVTVVIWSSNGVWTFFAHKLMEVIMFLIIQLSGEVEGIPHFVEFIYRTSYRQISKVNIKVILKFCVDLNQLDNLWKNADFSVNSVGPW